VEDVAITRASHPVDRGALDHWLRSAVEHRGCVRSWVHPVEPGYDYPEAAVLWLSWAAWRGEAHTEQARRVAARLLEDLTSQGSLGRGGQRYLFDSCLGLHALVRADVDLPFDRIVEGLARFEAPVQPRAGARWSERWTGHMDRAAALLLQAAHQRRSEPGVRLARRLRERASETSDYVHALAYAAEGELLFRALGEPARRAPERFAAQLAELQRADGALPAWIDGREGPRLDATAQAVRLWALIDRDHYDAPIQAALGVLATWQHRTGGICYDPRGHVNTWTSIFADQALVWAEGGANGLAWI